MLIKRLKNICIVFFIVFIVFTIKGADINKKDANGKQGLWKYYNRDRDLLYEINYKNDKKHGACVKYWPQNAKIREESNYFDGKLEEDFKQYYITGEIKKEGFYKEGKKDGLWATYDRITGEKRSEGNYKMNKKDGEWSYWNSKGQIIAKGKYLNNEKDGGWEYYDSEGKIKSTMSYVNGKKTGSDEPEIKNKDTKKTPAKKSSATQKTPKQDNTTVPSPSTPANPSDTTKTKTN